MNDAKHEFKHDWNDCFNVIRFIEIYTEIINDTYLLLCINNNKGRINWLKYVHANDKNISNQFKIDY